jgi:phosphoribosylpyrophosphate synthetase
VILIDDLISTGGTLVALVKAIREAGAQILEILTIGEKQENHGRRHLLEETDLSLKTMLVTTLVPSETGFRSKVVQVNLGDMPAWLAEKVAEHFPIGFCRSGSGEPCPE